jgi:hypothetical protein
MEACKALILERAGQWIDMDGIKLYKQLAAFCDEALQAEAMREAIGRAVERLPSLEHHAIDCGHHIRRAACDCGADERNLLFDSLRLDLSQSLNPKNEEGKS